MELIFEMSGCLYLYVLHKQKNYIHKTTKKLQKYKNTKKNDNVVLCLLILFVLGHICPNAELVPLWEFHHRGTAVHRRWNVLLGGPFIGVYNLYLQSNDKY